ncbi:MAG TPA: hypothetical protein VH302_03065 [Bryobacteraceae bacterium]|jgi:hypothetical protein|nr:hypothetical protein [Bryobacteraceae bacterium]
MNEIGFERQKRARVEEERRQSRQNQHDQTFKVRHASAEIHLQLKQQRLFERLAQLGQSVQLANELNFQKMAA